MTHHRNGHEIRHGVPGPEGSMPRMTAKTNHNRPPGTDSTGKGAMAKRAYGFVPCDSRCDIEPVPGQLAPQVTKPNA
jgi:hypothetical protein